MSKTIKVSIRVIATFTGVCFALIQIADIINVVDKKQIKP